MKASRPWMSLCIAVLALGNQVRADYVYQLVTDQASYSEQLGNEFDVTVYLQETVSGGDVSRLAGPDGGLVTAGVRLTFGTGAPAQVVSIDDIHANPAFTAMDFQIKDLPGDGTAGLSEAVDFFDPPVQGVETAAGVFRVELGVFHFKALAVGTFNLLVGDFSDLADTVAADGYAIDEPTSNLLTSSVPITIRSNGAVPEPLSVLSLLVGVTSIFAARRLRQPA